MKIRKSHLCQSSYEEAQIILEEIEKRRKVCLQHGRKQQSKENATKIWNAVEQKKHGLLMELSKSSKKQVFESVNKEEWEKRQNELEVHSEDMCMAGTGVIAFDPQGRSTICTQDNYLDDTDGGGTAGNWLLEPSLPRTGTMLLEPSLPSTGTSHQEPSFPPVPLILKDMTINCPQKSPDRNPEEVLKDLMSRIKCQREQWLASHSVMALGEVPQKDAQSPTFTQVHSHLLVTNESPIQQKWPSPQKLSTVMSPVVTHDYMDLQMHPEMAQFAVCPSPQIHPELAQLAMCPNKVQLTDVAEVLKQQESTPEKKKQFKLRLQQFTTHPEVEVQPTFYQLQKPESFPEQSLNDLSESFQTSGTPQMSYFMTDPSNSTAMAAHPAVISQTPYISWQQAILDREVSVPDQTVPSNQHEQLVGHPTYPVQFPLAAPQSAVFSNQYVQFPGQPVSFILHHYNSNSSSSSSSQATMNSIAPSHTRVLAPVVNGQGQGVTCHLVQSDYQPISVAIATDHLTSPDRACNQNNHQSSIWSDIGSMPASMSANGPLPTGTKLQNNNSFRHMQPSSLASAVKVKQKVKEHQGYSCVRHEQSEKVLDKSKADIKSRRDNLSPKLALSRLEKFETKYLETLPASSLPYFKGCMLQESISQKIVGQGQPLSVLSLLATLAAHPYYAATLCQPDGSDLSSEPQPITDGVAQYQEPAQYWGPHPDMNLDSNLRKHKSRNMKKFNHFHNNEAFKTPSREYEAYSQKCLDTTSASDIISAPNDTGISLTEKGRNKLKPATKSMQQTINRRLLANEQSVSNTNNKVECCTDDSQMLLGGDDSKSGEIELRKQCEEIQQHNEEIRKYRVVPTDNMGSNHCHQSGLSAIHGTLLTTQAPNGEQPHISLGECYGQKKSAVDERPRSGIYSETLSQSFGESSEVTLGQPWYSMASGDGLSSNHNCCSTFLPHQQMHTPTDITCLTGTSAEVSHQRVKKELKQTVKPTMKVNTYSISGDDEQISDESWRSIGLKNGDSNVAHLNNYTMSTTSESTQNNIRTDTFSSLCLFPIEGQSTEKLLKLSSEKSSSNLAPYSIISNLLRDSGESVLKSASLMDFSSEQTYITGASQHSQSKHRDTEGGESLTMIVTGNHSGSMGSTGRMYLQERLDNLDKLINESKNLIDKHRQMIDKNDIEVPPCSSSLLVCNKRKNGLICDHTDQPLQSIAKVFDERFHIEMGSSTFSLSSNITSLASKPDSNSSPIICDTGQPSLITSQLTNQPSPIISQLTSQSSPITSKVTCQPSPITSKVTCQQSPITTKVTCQPSLIRSQLTCQPSRITSEFTSQPLPIKLNITSDTSQPSPFRSKVTSQPSPVTSEFTSDTSQLSPIRSKFTYNTNQPSVRESHRSSNLDENSLDYLAEHSQGIMDEPLPELFNMILSSDHFILEDFNETEWLSESSDSLKSFEKHEMAEAECIHSSNSNGDDSLAGNSKTDGLHGTNETPRNNITFHKEQHEMAAMECVLVQHTQCEDSNAVFKAIPVNVDKHTLSMAVNINCVEMGRSRTVLNTKELNSFDNAKNSSEVKFKESKDAVAAGKSLNKMPQPQEADDSAVKDTKTKSNELVPKSEHSVGSRSPGTDSRARFGFHSAVNQFSRSYRAQHPGEIAKLSGATGLNAFCN